MSRGKERREAVKSCIITENRKRGNRRAARQGTVSPLHSKLPCLLSKVLLHSPSNAENSPERTELGRLRRMGLHLHTEVKALPLQNTKKKKKEKSHCPPTKKKEKRPPTTTRKNPKKTIQSSKNSSLKLRD